MQVLNQFYIKSVVRKALDEDLKPRGDITTNIVSEKNKIIKEWRNVKAVGHAQEVLDFINSIK